MANTSDGLRMTTHSPEELERFAALFIPTWELPAEVAAGPDPGFKPAAMDVATVTALTEPAKPLPVKSTMMNIAVTAPAAPPVEEKVEAKKEPLAAPMPSVIVAPEPEPVAAPAAAAPIAPPPAFRAPPVESIDDDLAPAPKKKGGMIFAVIGGLAAVGAIVAFVATRGGDEKAKETPKTEQASEKKALDLPEPTAAPVEAKKTEPAAKAPEPAKTAEPTPAPKETATAKAPEPTPTPKATAAPPPPPPVKAAAAPPPPPAPKATTAPAPKPAAAPAKKASKIKDEF